jgi:hypothetical protein
MVSLMSRLFGAMRQHGVVEALALVPKNLAYEFRWYLDRRFDRLHGTDTSDRIELAGLDVAGDRAQGVYYEPTSTGLFHRMMAQVRPAVPCEDFVFIDYGSGKGRTLMMASDYPFKAIVGVEFSRELHLVAQRNLAIYRGKKQRCTTLSAVHADAAQYQPPRENLFVYFYNPFLREVMKNVMDRLAQVSREHSARIVLVYFNPQSADIVERCGVFKRRLELRLPHDFSRADQRRCAAFFSWADAPGSTITPTPDVANR